jgi:hypothetical protein
MATPARNATAGIDQLIVEGIQTQLDPARPFSLNGKEYTSVTLAALIQRRTDLFAAIERTKRQWLGTIAEYEALNEELAVVLPEFRIQLFGIYGRDNVEMLAKFGFAPPKKPVRTVDANAAAAAKARATRKARRTMGKKQRLKIKGTVPETTPVVAPPEAQAPAVEPTGTDPTNQP